MTLQYIQHSVPNRVHSSYYSSKEVKLVYNSVQVNNSTGFYRNKMSNYASLFKQVVFDRDVWKRLHSYFAEAPRSKLLDKAVGETVDAVVESVLYDYIQFRLEVSQIPLVSFF